MPNRLPVARPRPWWLVYGVALATVCAAAILTPLMAGVQEWATFAFFFAAIAVTAAVGGLWPALAATLISLVTHRVLLAGA